jgi:uncharacterized protein
MLHFEVSGVETWWWLPIIIAFIVSAVSSTGGLSGAVFLLPIQLSLFGFAGPSVSSTNLFFNVIASPGGVYRYWHEKRLVAPIVRATVLGTLPGVFLGALLRIWVLPDASSFKPFVGAVLLYLGVRLLIDALTSKASSNGTANGGSFSVSNEHFTLKRLGFTFDGINYEVSTQGVLFLSLIVGIIGGAYGIGGSAIISPFLVAVFGFPIHVVAGACLMGTFFTSAVGVIFYWGIAPFFDDPNLHISPDWALGALFGVGGLVGTYVGARFQKRLPPRIIKSVLGIIVVGVGVLYLMELLK